jgi:hypothetical protein
MEDFPGNLPGNSNVSKMTKEERVEVEPEETKTSDAPEENETGAVKKVANGRVRRKPLAVRFRDMFRNEDEQENFGEYLLNHVIIPMTKDLIINTVKQTLDGISNGVEDRVGGSSRARGGRSTVHGSVRHTDYTAPSRSNRVGSSAVRSAPAGPRVVIRRSNRVQDVLFDTREDALDVKEDLQAKIDDFGHCTVGDLYAASGIRPKSTDEAWGWDDLSEARVRSLSTGDFQLVVPQPIEIQNY